MKVLITGSNGMLGHDLIEVLKDEHELILTTSKTLDITNKDKVIEFIGENKPDVVINSAAYTDVDGCEENQETAYAVNGDGVRNLALACSEVDCPLVHVSTDYIFNGENTRPWVEDDEIGPISVYGKSQLKGEEAILEILDKFFIVRTAWLYGINGGNFPKTMLELVFIMLPTQDIVLGVNLQDIFLKWLKRMLKLLRSLLQNLQGLLQDLITQYWKIKDGLKMVLNHFVIIKRRLKSILS